MPYFVLLIHSGSLIICQIFHTLLPLCVRRGRIKEGEVGFIKVYATIVTIASSLLPHQLHREGSPHYHRIFKIGIIYEYIGLFLRRGFLKIELLAGYVAPVIDVFDILL